MRAVTAAIFGIVLAVVLTPVAAVAGQFEDAGGFQRAEQTPL